MGVTRARTIIAMTVATVLLPAPVAAEDLDGPTSAGAAALYTVGAVISGGTEAGTVGRRINEAGNIAGWSNYPLDAYRWTSGSGVEFLPGLPGDEHEVAHDVNDAKVVVGYSGRETIEPPQRAVRWVGGEPGDLGSLEAGGDSQANALNNDATVVGWSMVGSDRHAFMWTESAGMVDLAPDSSADALDINERGHVTGYRNNRAYVWDAGTLRLLEQPPGFPRGYGMAINDRGQVAGRVASTTGNAERLVRWTADGEVEVLGGVGEDNEMLGINNDGTVVGIGVPGSGPPRGVVHREDIGLRALTDLLDSDDWAIIAAFDVNDRGQIVAQGSNTRTGEVNALRLDPIGKKTMTDTNLRVVVRGDVSKAVARLRVVDASEQPVRGANVRAEWYVDDELVDPDDADRTDAGGRAKTTLRLGGFGSPGNVELCITTITKRGFRYVPSSGEDPPCVATDFQIGQVAR